jgi:hypothetical protein
MLLKISSDLKGQTLCMGVQANFEAGIDDDRSAQDEWIRLVLVHIQDIPLAMSRLWTNIGDKYIRLE